MITIDNTNYTVEGNNYVKTHVGYYLNGDKYESISKRNWKTGWLTYSYEKTSNDTHTIVEEEITSDSSSITRIEITTIFVGLTIIAIVVSRKRKQTK